MKSKAKRFQEEFDVLMDAASRIETAEVVYSGTMQLVKAAEIFAHANRDYLNESIYKKLGEVLYYQANVYFCAAGMFNLLCGFDVLGRDLHHAEKGGAK